MSHSDTRAKLIEAGRALMLARGFSGTRVEEICRQAGVSKGAFYHLFESKEELALAVLEGYYQAGVGRLMAGDFARIDDPRRRASAFFDHLESIAAELWQHGCLLGNFATELAESNPAIHARVGKLFDRLARSLAPLLAPLADEPQSASAVALAEQLLASLEGSIVLARAHAEPQRIVEGIRRFRRLIERRQGGRPSSATA
jgi:TetR/AcrR family transcriptional regulator, transcriptional repressor for nem operon